MRVFKRQGDKLLAPASQEYLEQAGRLVYCCDERRFGLDVEMLAGPGTRHPM
jgi:hypothetical protein